MPMAGTSPKNRQFACEQDDLLRGGVIALLAALCLLTTVFSFAHDIDLLTTPIFFLPVIYAVYAFPRRGIIVAAICACAYEVTGYVFRYPDPVELAAITVQAVLFVGIAGIIAFLIEHTKKEERQRLEEKIRRDNEQRRGIVMTVAHELRTPLQPIIGYLNLLLDDPDEAGLTEETQTILKRCLESADRERHIINRMLDLSVLDSGKIQLATTRFSLFDLVQSVIDTNGYAAMADITVKIPKKITVAADMNRIFVVVDSILSNAVRYSSPPRTVVVDYHSDDTDPFCHISVTDNGIGISPEAQGSIFEPFQLADGTTLSRKCDRIGLSLAIAKKIIIIHGGDITFESTPGTGSTFTIHLPKVPQV
jgi:signal transduction histidine kinase